MDDDLALQQLRALLAVPGALKLISSAHACGAGLTAGHKDGFDQAVCDAYQYPVEDPRHWVLLDVTGLEGPDDDGMYRATTDDGSWCEGTLAGILLQTQRWQAAR